MKQLSWERRQRRRSFLLLYSFALFLTERFPRIGSQTLQVVHQVVVMCSDTNTDTKNRNRVLYLCTVEYSLHSFMGLISCIVDEKPNFAFVYDDSCTCAI